MTRPQFDRVNEHTFLASALPPDPVVVDLGANHGGYSRAMRGRFGGTYHLVEANPGLFEELSGQGHHRVSHCAVNDVDGTITFNIAENDEGSSLLTLPKESIIDCVLKEAVEVPSRTVESILDEVGAPRVDILKMDIEGAEGRVIRSLSPERLRTIGQITVEFHSHGGNFGFDLQADTASAIAHLERNGFLCLDFSAGAFTDTLFLNRELLRIPPHLAWAWSLKLHAPVRLRKDVRRLMEPIKRPIRRLVKGRA